MSDDLIAALRVVQDPSREPAERFKALQDLRADVEQVEADLLREMRRQHRSWREIAEYQGIRQTAARDRARRRGVTE